MEDLKKNEGDLILQQGFGAETDREKLLAVEAEEEHSFAYLDPLKNESEPASFLQLLVLSAMLVKDTIMVASAYVGPFVFTACIYKYLGMTVDNMTQAAFGISNSFVLVFFNSFIYSGMDKIGISLSQKLGAKDFSGYRQNFWQGVVCSWGIFFAATLPLFVFSGSLLAAVGIEVQTALTAQKYLRMFLPMAGLEVSSQLVRTFCVAQGQESLIGKTTFANTIICIIIGYYLIVVKNQGLWGSVVLKGIYETLNLLIGSVILRFQTHAETRGFTTFSSMVDGLWEFSADMIQFILGTYSELLGFEITSLFVARFHDNDEIFAYAASASLVNGCYNVGMALSLIGRTRINYLIGQNEQNAAKNLFSYLHKIGMVVGLIACILIYPNAKHFAKFLTGSNAVAAGWAEKIVQIYSCFLFSEFSLYLAFIGVKSIGKIRTLLLINLIFAVIGNYISCSIMSHFEFRSPYMFLNLMLITALVNALSYFISAFHDWSNIKG